VDAVIDALGHGGERRAVRIGSIVPGDTGVRYV
jgi:hypothetical protein